MDNDYSGRPFERNVRRKLEHWEAPPPPDAWDAIESQLPEQPGRRKRPLVLAILVLIPALLVGGAGYLLWTIPTPAGEVAEEAPAQDALLATAPTERFAAGEAAEPIALPETPDEATMDAGESIAAPELTTGTVFKRGASAPPAEYQEPMDKLSATEGSALASQPLPFTPAAITLQPLLSVDKGTGNSAASSNPARHVATGDLAIGIRIAPLVSGMHLSRNPAYQQFIRRRRNFVGTLDLLEERRNREAASTGLAASIHLKRSMGKGWTLATGLDYQLYRIHRPESAGDITSSDSLAIIHAQTAGVQDLAHFTYSTEAYTGTTSSYHYLSVPLLVGHTWQCGRWGWFAESGVAADLMVRAKTDILDNYSWPFREDGLAPLNRWNLSLRGNAGVSYALSERLEMTAGPTVSYSLLSVIPKNNIQQSPYYLGVGIGANYFLK